MRIEKIFIRNFRSIGENGLTINLSGKNLTTIVGENNVGKSSIFEALKLALGMQRQRDDEDWHSKDKSNTIEIKVECILDNNQLKQVCSLLALDFLSVDRFKEYFTDKNKIICSFERTSREDYLYVTLGALTISTSTGWLGNRRPLGAAGSVPWHGIYEEIKLHPDKDPISIIKDKTSNVDVGGRYFTVDFKGSNLSEEAAKILQQGTVIVEEFREKPDKSKNDLLKSPTGRYLASVLSNLKNGPHKERVKFEKIQDEFVRMFPGLKPNTMEKFLDYSRSEVKIVIEKSQTSQMIESTTDYMGAGILESLLVLAHLIAHDDKVLFLDGPELHLHPHIQRRLGSFLEESLENSQLVVITHSPYFVSLNRNSNVLRVIQKNAQTEVIELPQKYLTDNDFSKLEQFLDIDTKELFFARKVLLVEGPTELGALPIFASHVDYNFDENGVTVITVDGKLSFEVFIKLCEGFKIPYLIVADKDAETGLAGTAPKLILPSIFDELLPLELREEARKVLGIHKQGQGKPRIGRYVAKKMIAEGKEVPDVIKQIINGVKTL